MHQFWRIDELVRVVASDLEKRCGASASALALACCSKQLSDIVLDSIWEALEGLGRLMRCLPQESWEIRDDEFVRSSRAGSYFGRSLTINRFSYVPPPLRSGSVSRATLVGCAPFASRKKRGFHQRRFAYYLCRPNLWVTTSFLISVPSDGTPARGSCYPPSSTHSWLSSTLNSPTMAHMLPSRDYFHDSHRSPYPLDARIYVK